MADLDEAVQAAVHAEAITPGLTVTEYVVIAAASGWNDDGEPVTSVTVLPSDAPTHRIVGLVEEARVRFHADILDNYREG